ncbi:MAG: hypothetical protein H6R04_1898 [Burkholderiaceae bacterium]|nr:hypothetical protein [Burkholderiaceae bacterium]
MANDPQNQPNPLPFPQRVAAAWNALAAGYRRANAAAWNLPGILLKLLLAVYFLFCLAFLSLRFFVLPNIGQYKGDIERLASRALSMPVSVASIDASWHGLRPQLQLEGVVVRDRQGRAALNLPGVKAVVAWRSIPSFGLRLHRLEIRQPDLDIRRDANGKLYVAGLPISTEADSDGAGADWVMQQQEIVIRDGQLRWTDEMRKAPELALKDVNLILQNGWRHHRFQLRATPPAALAAPLDVRADFVHPLFAKRISDVRLWKGELYADVQNTDLIAWKPYVDYPFEIERGSGAVRAWLTLDHAKLADFTADLRLADVFARLRKDLVPLDLVEVKGRVSAHEDFSPEHEEGTPTFGTHGHAVSLTDFSLKTKDGLTLPETTVSESYVPGKGDAPGTTKLTTRQLDLNVLASFTKYLPLSADMRQMLADFAPSGQLKDFSVEWQGNYPELVSYRLNGQFANLSMKAQKPRAARPASGKTPAQPAIPGIPGFDNLTGRVDANQKGGNFTLDADKLTLQLPGYFADPSMMFDTFKMQANWAFLPQDQFQFQVDKMEFTQQGLRGSFSGKHLMPLVREPGKPAGTIDLQGKLDNFDANTIHRYLPLQMPEYSRQWLGNALEDGKAQDVVIRLKGDLADFPFKADKTGRRPKGEFKVSMRLENCKLNYTPGKFAKDGKSPMWPQAEQINGSLSITNERMEIRGDTAKTANVDLQNVLAVIPDLTADDMMLEISGLAAGALPDFVRYTTITPVADWIGNFTEDTKAAGNAKLALKFSMPINRARDTTVQGSLQFLDNEVNLLKGLPLLSRVKGKLEFSEKGFGLHGISAHFLGGATTITGGTQSNGALLVKANGTLTSDALRQTYPALSNLFSGNTRYALTINGKGRQPEITLESNLRWMALALPEPLKKPANDALPLKLKVTAMTAPAGTLRDEIRVTLGPNMSARYVRQKSSAKNSPWRLVQGGIGVNTSAPEQPGELVLAVAARTLNLDTWQKTLSPAAQTKSQKAAKVSPADELEFAQYIEPDRVTLKTGQLSFSGLSLEQAEVNASQRNGNWQADIKSTQVNGRVGWQDLGTGKAKVVARLASLTVPKTAVSDVSGVLTGEKGPSQIPALDIVAENFDLFGKKLGRIELAASNTPGSGGREWNIDKLALSNPDGTLRASGKWNTQGGRNVTKMAYALQVANAGKLLGRLGYADVLRNGKGRIDGHLEWHGSPFTFDIPSLSGQVNMAMEAGQFLKAEPGAGRLLGVLSLQSLPRRLSLDFRDIFSAGFAFDGITANASIANGVAKTDNLKMRGLNANVLIEGVADIGKETQNLHVVVIPEISASAASVAYGLAINPVIGVGTFLAQLVLRDPLRKILTYEYQVTGSWSDPTVTKINRKLGEALSASSISIDS